MMNEHERQTSIKDLEKLAKEVLNLKQELVLRKPLLIEFCGSPKSGKSTTINALNIFLKRNGFSTVVLTERASVCPINSKTHPFFNLWTLTSAMAEIIEHLDRGKDKVDIIIADRGLFDALCWFEWLSTNPSEDHPYLESQAYKTLQDFIFMDMWYGYLDIIYVFKVKPEVSIEREFATLLTEQRGTIMNESVLGGFNIAIDSVSKKFKSKFKEIIHQETDTTDTNRNPNEVSRIVSFKILEKLKALLVEKIGFLDSTIKLQLNHGVNPFNLIENQTLSFQRRDIVEETFSLQPIAIAVFTNIQKDKVLVVKKSDKRVSIDSPEKDKLLLYIGGHSRQEDNKSGNTLLKTLENTLHREIQEEIGESINITTSNPFIIYTPDNKKSKKHIAVCFIITMDLEGRKFKLTSDEFVMKTGTSKSGHILTIDEYVREIESNKHEIEPWSEHILKEVFEKKIKKNTLELFPNEQKK